MDWGHGQNKLPKFRSLIILLILESSFDWPISILDLKAGYERESIGAETDLL